MHKVFNKNTNTVLEPLRYKIGLAFDRRSIQTQNDWVGVVLRNIPSGFKSRDIII